MAKCSNCNKDLTTGLVLGEGGRDLAFLRRRWYPVQQVWPQPRAADKNALLQ